MLHSGFPQGFPIANITGRAFNFAISVSTLGVNASSFVDKPEIKFDIVNSSYIKKQGTNNIRKEDDSVGSLKCKKKDCNTVSKNII